MAVAIGKRKRGGDSKARDEETPDGDEMRLRFQRAFEAKFKPLERSSQPKRITENAHDEVASGSEDSDFSGFSEDEEEEDEGDHVEVIDHDQTRNGNSEVARSEMRSFMSSKPPSASAKPPKSVQKSKEETEDDASENANLKHDLALQRLLKESHLLDPSSFSGSSSAPEGKSRLKALDLRLQDLGAKKGTLEQERMPLAHRKGIKAKAANREATRRKDAAENGIILERAKTTKAPEKRRERGIGGPSVGKLQGSTLKLSSRDVKSIEGSRQAPRGKGRKR